MGDRMEIRNDILTIIYTSSYQQGNLREFS